MSDILINDLKIGRHKYNIATSDEFMDNGLIIQLLTQSKESTRYGAYTRPVLSAKAIKEINKFAKTQVAHRYAGSISVFSITVKE